MKKAFFAPIGWLLTRPPRAARPEKTMLAWADQVAAEIDCSQLEMHVRAFSAPRNRLHHRAAMVDAEEAIMAAFSNAGFNVERSAFTFSNVVGNRDHGDFDKAHYDELSGVNVVGLLPGETQGAVVVLAHYDTVRDSPGANDNAASVVGLMALARTLGGHRYRHSIVLAATDMEELGMFGATALVRELTARYRVRLAINFESMAYTCASPDSQRLPAGLEILYPRQVAQIRRRQMRSDFTALIYNAAAARDAAMLRSALHHVSLGPAAVLLRDPNRLPVVGRWLRENVRAARHFRRSDHVAFWDAGLAAVQVTDTADHRYSHYHRPTDTADRLDYERLRDLIAATGAVVAWRAGYKP